MRARKTQNIIAVVSLIPLSSVALSVRASSRFEVRHQKGPNKAVIGIVEKMNGKSRIQRSGRPGRFDVSLGLRVFESDRLSTGRSRLHVRYKDGTYCELGEDSSFEVERVRFKPANPLSAARQADQFDESVFRFWQGIVRVTAPDIHPLEYFTVKTSNAIVRATGPADFYLIQLSGDRDLAVRVARGKLELINAITNERVTVPEGTGAYLKVSGVAVGAGRFTNDQQVFLKSRTRI